MDPPFPPFDRDPLHVEPDPDIISGSQHQSPLRMARVSQSGASGPTDEARTSPDGVPGPAIVLVIAGIPLLACIVFAVWWLAIR
jgi:hypothetical protein